MLALCMSGSWHYRKIFWVVMALGLAQRSRVPHSALASATVRSPTRRA